MVYVNVRAHVIVSGRVQGVFFRSETGSHARRLNVKGWVRNLVDGRVEGIFEGEESNVKQLIDYCKRGPPSARVTSVNVSWETYSGEFSRFEVRSAWDS
jgi:acylphosphatase